MEYFGAVFKLDLTEERRTQLQEVAAVVASCLTLATSMITSHVTAGLSIWFPTGCQFNPNRLSHTVAEILCQKHLAKNIPTEHALIPNFVFSEHQVRRKRLFNELAKNEIENYEILKSLTFVNYN